MKSYNQILTDAVNDAQQKGATGQQLMGPLLNLLSSVLAAQVVNHNLNADEELEQLRNTLDEHFATYLLAYKRTPVR